MTTWYNTWDDSSSTIRGHITIMGASNTTANVFAVTGAVIVGTGYYKIPVSFVSGTIPTNGAVHTVSFSRTGDLGSAGLAHIATQTFTTVSGVSVNSCFSSTYENYLIIVKATGNAVLTTTMRLRAAGTDIVTSTYSNSNISTNWAASNTFEGNSSGTSWALRRFHTDPSTKEISVFAPNTADAYKTMFYRGVDAMAFTNVGSGVSFSSTAADGFTLTFTGGTGSGTIRVYGYKNS
jgi:hypothetical protein